MGKVAKVKLEPRKRGCRAGYDPQAIPAHTSLPPTPNQKKKRKKRPPTTTYTTGPEDALPAGALPREPLRSKPRDLDLV